MNDLTIEVDRLVRVLQRAVGFTFLIAVCDHAGQRAGLCEEIAERFGSNLAVLTVDHEVVDFRTLLTDAPAMPCLMILGLEYWMHVQSAELHPFWATLNSSREALKRDAPHTVVLWVTHSLLPALLRGAPDLASGNSGIFNFPSPPLSTPIPLLWLKFPAEAGLPLEDKRLALTLVPARLAKLKRPLDLAVAVQRAARLMWWLGFEKDALTLLDSSELFLEAEPEVALIRMMRLHFSAFPGELVQAALHALEREVDYETFPTVHFDIQSFFFQLYREWQNADRAQRAISRLKLILSDLRFLQAPDVAEREAQVVLYEAVHAADRGLFKIALRLTHECRGLRRRVWAPDHPHALEADYLLSCIWLRQGRVADARRRRKHVLKTWRRYAGPRHAASRVLVAAANEMLEY